MTTIRNITALSRRYMSGIDLMALTIFWIISLAVVNPSGNFPLNDDWSFALTVKNLIANGDYHPTEWVSMPLITNVLWGYLFTIPTGFSYDALRLSTLVLSLLGMLATYVLARDLCLPRFFGIISALTLGFNPIYYALSNTFMTDVPFTALTIIASVFLVRYLKTGANWPFLIGTTLIVVATLSRQLAISVPLGFGVAIILKQGITRRSVLHALIPLIFCVGSLFIYQEWLHTTGKMPALYYAKTNELIHALENANNLLFAFGSRIYIALLYLGLFLSPVLLYIMVGMIKTQKKTAIILLSLSTMVILVAGILIHGSFKLMPLGDNIIVNSGIGALVLRDVFILELNNVPALSSYYWLLVTVVSVSGAGMLITTLGFSGSKLANKFRPGTMTYTESSSVLLLLSAFIQIAPLILAGFFDRYFVPMITLFGIGIATACSPMIRIKPIPHCIPIVALLLAISYFSICGTRDYLTWNRIRWAALDNLITQQNVDPKDIDGGFEFNGLHFYDSEYLEKPGKSWWWVQNDKYILTFGPISGYEVANEYSFTRWMPLGVGHIFVLRRQNDD